VLYYEEAIRRAWATVAPRAGADAGASHEGVTVPEVPDAVRSAVIE
jgi:hypothetical protein